MKLYSPDDVLRSCGFISVIVIIRLLQLKKNCWVIFLNSTVGLPILGHYVGLFFKKKIF